MDGLVISPLTIMTISWLSLAVTVTFPPWVVPMAISALVLLTFLFSIKRGGGSSPLSEIADWMEAMFEAFVVLLIIAIIWIVYLIWLYYHTMATMTFYR